MGAANRSRIGPRTQNAIGLNFVSCDSTILPGQTDPGPAVRRLRIVRSAWHGVHCSVSIRPSAGSPLDTGSIARFRHPADGAQPRPASPCIGRRPVRNFVFSSGAQGRGRPLSAWHGVHRPDSIGPTISGAEEGAGHLRVSASPRSSCSRFPLDMGSFARFRQPAARQLRRRGPAPCVTLFCGPGTPRLRALRVFVVNLRRTDRPQSPLDMGCIARIRSRRLISARPAGKPRGPSPEAA